MTISTPGTTDIKIVRPVSGEQWISKTMKFDYVLVFFDMKWNAVWMVRVRLDWSWRWISLFETHFRINKSIIHKFERKWFYLRTVKWSNKCTSYQKYANTHSLTHVRKTYQSHPGYISKYNMNMWCVYKKIAFQLHLKCQNWFVSFRWCFDNPTLRYLDTFHRFDVSTSILFIVQMWNVSPVCNTILLPMFFFFFEKSVTIFDECLSLTKFSILVQSIHTQSGVDIIDDPFI